MKNNKNEWREKAQSYLLRNTTAIIDEVEHFVNCLWIQEYSKEENLSLFQEYCSEVADAFSA